MSSFAGAFLREFLSVLREAAPWILFGFAIAAVVQVLLPVHLVQKLLGRGRVRGVAMASLLGIPLPLCSCSVVPTALALRRRGASKGATVAFAERFTRGSGYHTGWIWAGGRPQRFQLRDIDGFNVTAAAALPDGGLLLLERYFTWSAGVKMRIRRLAAAEIRPGARLGGHVVVEADSGYEIDNMEGIAVHRGGRGETVVSLISDNNFNRFLQRTVLLQFALAGE